uniref:Carbohydrate kinase PfkB domain-containing protein n=1 Tax=Arion vulgaris TaxID=1028688 RepID=A0A0B7A2K0_9EUPU
MADCLSKLDCNPVFISATGNDSLADGVLQYCNHIDMLSVPTLNNVSTATYCPVLLASGQLLFGVGNMDINTHFSLNKVSDLDAMIKSAPLVVLDSNFTSEVIESVVFKCVDMSVPVWFEPTDLLKSTKPFETDAWKHLTFISPNLGELVLMYRALMRKHDQQCNEIDVSEENTRLEDILEIIVQMCVSMVAYIPIILVTLGKHGILLCHNFGDVSHLLPLPIVTNLQFKATYYRAFDCHESLSKIVSVSGAGDCFASAFIAGMLQGLHLDLCVKQGLLAASLSLQSTSAVPATITTNNILKAGTSNTFFKWQSIDVSSGHSDLL